MQFASEKNSEQAPTRRIPGTHRGSPFMVRGRRSPGDLWVRNNVPGGKKKGAEPRHGGQAGNTFTGIQDREEDSANSRQIKCGPFLQRVKGRAKRPVEQTGKVEATCKVQEDPTVYSMSGGEKQKHDGLRVPKNGWVERSKKRRRRGL